MNDIDIDFDALDQAINSAMTDKIKRPESKKSVSVKRAQAASSRGKSMDFLSNSDARAVRNQKLVKVKKPVRQKVSKQRAVSKTIEDIFRPANTKKSVKKVVKPVKKVTPKVAPKPVAKTEAKNKPLLTPAQPELNHLRQRRRLHHLMTDTENQAVGHYQSETISKHTKDGDLYYKKSSLDYVTKPEIKQDKVSLAETAPVEIIKPVQVKKGVKPQRIKHNKPSTAAEIKEKPTSPFLETVQVEKRPLGVPADRFKPSQSVKKVVKNDHKEQLEVAEEEPTQTALYRNDHKLADQEESEKSFNWLLFLMGLFFIVGVCLIIWWVFQYNS